MSANHDFDFDFNQESAESADRVANKIVEGGAYVGKIIEAEGVVAGTGAKGIKLTFETKEGGKTTDTLYYRKEDGTPIGIGADKINAILALLKVYKLKPEKGTVHVWEDGKLVDKEGWVFPQLLDQTIGVVLQEEIGDKKSFFRLYAFFDAETRRTASEVLAGAAKPVKLDRILHALQKVDKRSAGGSPLPDALPDVPSGTF